MLIYIVFGIFCLSLIYSIYAFVMFCLRKKLKPKTIKAVLTTKEFKRNKTWLCTYFYEVKDKRYKYIEEFKEDKNVHCVKQPESEKTLYYLRFPMCASNSNKRLGRLPEKFEVILIICGIVIICCSAVFAMALTGEPITNWL